ncbi:MAG: hypothetical protein U0L20_06485 [Ruminococcus sp.]|nr:hypothetical protein [Ruminococcus sp.]
MKPNFNNETEFAKLEDKAIDGQLDYSDYPPEEYKYFSKLSKLGYYNRHKGWSVEICKARQSEFKKIYLEEKDSSNTYLNLSKRILENVFLSMEYIRQMYKSDDKDEIILLAFKTIEGLTNENGFTKRMKERLDTIIKNIYT